MKTKITIIDKTALEQHEYAYTDRLSLFCLIESLTEFAEFGNYEDGHEYDIQVREER